MSGRPCSVCRTYPKLAGVTRCVRCQSVFNALRETDPDIPSGGGERRRAPTTDEIRAAIKYGSWRNRQKAQAGHTRRPQERDVPADPEVRDALGVLRDWRAQKAGKPGYVYCIAEANEGTPPELLRPSEDHLAALLGISPVVKIGYSTNPEARLGELQTGNPRTLLLLRKMRATVADEERLHAKYIDANVLGEWFYLSAELLREFPRERRPVPSDGRGTLDPTLERNAA